MDEADGVNVIDLTPWGGGEGEDEGGGGFVRTTGFFGTGGLHARDVVEGFGVGVSISADRAVNVLVCITSGDV